MTATISLAVTYIDTFIVKAQLHCCSECWLDVFMRAPHIETHIPDNRRAWADEIKVRHVKR